MFTRQEIADKAGTYKMAVNRYIEQNKIKAETKKGNTFYYSKSQMLAIVKGMNATGGTKQTETSNETKEQQENSTRELIDALKKQITQQAKQIESDRRQIEKLQQLLDQQQRLNLSTQNLLEQQKVSPETHSKDDKQHEQTNTQETQEKPSEDTEKPRQPWWKFWG